MSKIIIPLDDVVDDYINTGTLRGDVVVQDSTTGLVCFTCTFVEGSQSLGCSTCVQRLNIMVNSISIGLLVARMLQSV